MELILPIEIKKLAEPITYKDRIMLVGSCFTEHIGNSLARLKFQVLQNPNGILFNPYSVCQNLLSYIEPRIYEEKDLFLLNETYNSWQHHSRFSHLQSSGSLNLINNSQHEAHRFLQQANWLIITLGSAFGYRLTSEASLGSSKPGDIVANNHRAPASWFQRDLMETKEIIRLLSESINRIKQFNPLLKFIFTVSPVRHIREGVIENNRSKARLIESVHEVSEQFPEVYYFPAYELVIDVLRDYRYYDIDLVHPNYAATTFVLEKFSAACIDEKVFPLMEELQKLSNAKRHRPFQPATRAHKEFLKAQLEKAKAIQQAHPYINLSEEIDFFSQSA